MKGLGNQGEYQALIYLKDNGLELIEKNFCKQGGQIDLVMYDNLNDEIVFVEVKTRKIGYQRDLVISQRQAQTILKTAEYWLSKNEKQESQARVDLVLVEKKEDGYSFNWFKNVIY